MVKKPRKSGTQRTSRAYLLLALVIIAFAVLGYITYEWSARRKEVRRSAPAADAGAPDYKQLFAQLMEVIKAHPRTEIREDLQRLFLQGLKVSFREESKHVAYGENVSVEAGFLVLPQSAGYPTDVPVLIIDPVLLSPSRPVEYLQRKLFHEYHHINNYFTGRYPPFRFYPRTYRTDPIDPHFMMESEMEAYTGECEFAIVISYVIPNVSDPCRVFQQKGRYGLALWLAENFGTSWNDLRPYRQQLLDIAESYRSP